MTDKTRLTYREALEIERQIYERLKREIEEGIEAEAEYWRFLDDDDIEAA